MPEPTTPPSAPHRPLNEALRAFGVAMLLLGAAAGISLAVPWVRANLGFIAALIFILVPGNFLRKRGEHDAEYGLSLADWRPGLLWGLGTTLVTLALFIPSYHLWTTKVEARVAHVDVGNYLRVGEAFQGRPHAVQDGNVHVWTWGQQLVVDWSPKASPYTLDVRVEPEGDAGGLALTPAAHGAGELTTSATRRGGAVRHEQLVLHPTGVRSLVVRATEGGQTVEPQRFRAGARGKAWAGEDAETIKIPLGYGWLFSALLTQLVLVAIPEEFFFRGFLQERLHQQWGRRGLRVFGLTLTWGIVASSVLFALSHLFVGFGLHRLAVFFPSLLFGALRERTGGISASVLYHAACNLMVILLSVHYF